MMVSVEFDTSNQTDLVGIATDAGDALDPEIKEFEFILDNTASSNLAIRQSCGLEEGQDKRAEAAIDV